MPTQKKQPKLVDLVCRKCEVVAFAGFVICSGPCGGCFHFKCVGLDINAHNAVTVNESIHWFCESCNQTVTIVEMHRKLDTLISNMEGFLGDWKSFCTPVLETRKVTAPEVSAQNSSLRINPAALNKSLERIANARAQFQSASSIEWLQSSATSSSPAPQQQQQQQQRQPKPKMMRTKIKTRPKTTDLQRPGTPIPKPIQPPMPAPLRHTGAIPKIPKAPKVSIPLQNPDKPEDSEPTSSPSADMASGDKQRPKTASHRALLKAALRNKPPIVGSGQSLGSLRAADRVVMNKKCLLVTNLDVSCTPDDVTSNLIANCEASPDDMRVSKLSLRGTATYSSFKVWCLPRVFELALSSTVWPQGCIVREFIPISKNWGQEPPKAKMKAIEMNQGGMEAPAQET